MTISNAFEWLCENLEAATDLNRLEARGTVRIALKHAGLEAGKLSAHQVETVLEKLMPGELEGRGIVDAVSICRDLQGRLSQVPTSDDATEENSPEAVFARFA